MRFGKAELKINFDKGWRKAPIVDTRPFLGIQKLPNGCWLEVKGTRWRYPLVNKHHIYIGRQSGNQIRLTDPSADNVQAVIYWNKGRYHINNLSSVRPTLVNGQTFTSQRLGNGNTIQVGRTKLIFRSRLVGQRKHR
jgi:hypothetical protein